MKVVAALLAIAEVGGSAPPVPQSLVEAVASPERSDRYRALDAMRRPVEVLHFARLGPGMRVLDVGVGGGYYTEILAQAVGPTGAVVGWSGPAFFRRPNVTQAMAGIRERFPNVTFYVTPTTSMALPREGFDLVLLHLTYHDFYWESADFGLAKVEPMAVARELFAATAPGGRLVVADHVAAGNRDPREEADKTHRIRPDVVRADFERAGFVFEEESALLRRADDDHSKRVFDPTIRGSTDRFLFRFRKPAGHTK